MTNVVKQGGPEGRWEGNAKQPTHISDARPILTAHIEIDFFFFLSFHFIILNSHEK